MIWNSRIIIVSALAVICYLDTVECGGKGGGGGGGRGKGGGGGEISGDLMSTLRIAARLCLGPHDDWIAKQFVGCYDGLPGKPQFFMCQKKVFGAVIDSEAHVNKTCLRTYRLPIYAVCIMKALRQAGVNMNKVVTKLNKCQGRVLGL